MINKLLIKCLKKTRLWICPVPLALSLMLITGCDRKKNTYTPPPPPKVTVSKPVQKKVTDYALFTGNTEAFESVEIRARVEGWLKSIHFKPSSMVKKGDLLFIIDPRTYQAQLNEKKAALLIQEAELNLAEATYKRKESAFKENAVSEVEVIEARAKVKKAKASIEAAKAGIEEARLSLSYTKIYAPGNGRIGRNLVDVGNLIGAAGEKTLLATIVNDSPIYAYFNVSEREMLNYTKNAREQKKSGRYLGEDETNIVYLGLSNEKGYPHKGRLDYIGNRIDEGTGTIQVRGIFPNSDKILISGLFVRIHLPISLPKDAFLITERAVGVDQRGKYLLTVNNDNVVEYKSVKLGAVVEGMYVIKEGISADDTIIVKGIQRARPGIKVNPQPEKSGQSKKSETLKQS